MTRIVTDKPDKIPKPVRRTEHVNYGEVVAGDWRFVFGEHGKDCKVYFKDYFINGVQSVRINASAGHIVTMNIELLPLRVCDMR